MSLHVAQVLRSMALQTLHHGRNPDVPRRDRQAFLVRWVRSNLSAEPLELRSPADTHAADGNTVPSQITLLLLRVPPTTYYYYYYYYDDCCCCCTLGRVGAHGRQSGGGGALPRDHRSPPAVHSVGLARGAQAAEAHGASFPALRAHVPRLLTVRSRNFNSTQAPLTSVIVY